MNSAGHNKTLLCVYVCVVWGADGGCVWGVGGVGGGSAVGIV